MNIKLTKNKATLEQVLQHLKKCDSYFYPTLSSTVNLEEYSKKIVNNAELFEAWDGDLLIGLLAAYFNDVSKINGYITNVSLLDQYKGKGIAQNLIEICLEEVGIRKFSSINLEVSVLNTAAIKLYQKYGFTEVQRTKDKIKMHKLFNYLLP